MKADEVVRRYEEGNRDFIGFNLSGQSFQGKNLAEADFSRANIRGTNFCEANLVGAKFVGAEAGLQKRWFVGLFMLFWLLLGLIFLVVFALLSALEIFLLIRNSGNFPAQEVIGETAINIARLYLKVLGILPLVDVYIVWRAFQGDKNCSWLYNAFVVARGTKFCSSDLTNADFTEAELKRTDFRKSMLNWTRWYNAKNIDCACVGSSYLSNEQIRRLLVKGEGNGENFDKQDLRNLDLSKFSLKNASFIDAYLYQTNLSGSDLSRALLIRTSLEQADLTNTRLKGACIEGWKITSRTKLNGAESEYVFMKFFDDDKRDEIKFEKGEFVSFIRSRLMTNSLELSHELNINSDVALAVLKYLSKINQTPLEIVGFWKQGNQFVLQVKIPEKLDREEIKEAYYLKYQELLDLLNKDPEEFNQLYFATKDTNEAKLLEKLEEGKNQNTVINNIKYIIFQVGNFGEGVNTGKTEAETIAGTASKPQNAQNEVMQMIKSLRQKIEVLDNQVVISEALKHLNDLETEVQSPKQKKSRLKAYLSTVWNIVEDNAIIANTVTELAARFDIQLVTFTSKVSGEIQ